ncbi:MAG: energy transducer TonB, partial [Flavobacteriales bacterium]
ISGKVVVCFTVDVNGYTTKHKIISPAHELLNKAALDVIKIVPKFESPAMKNGKPVEISYCLPVRFKLKDDL